MAATLRRLIATGHLGLRVLAGEAGLDRAVSWVAVSELADPTPYLEGGELVLLTGVGVALDGEQAAGYVDRLVNRGVAAIGFGTGVVHAQVPAALVAAAADRGLPLLEVDRPTPFVAVGKALADLLAAEQGERARRRQEGMRTLTSALARGGEPAAVRRLAALVGGWAGLLDPRGVVLAAGGQPPPARLEVAAGLARQLRGHGPRAGATVADVEGRVTVLPVGVGDRVRAHLALGVAAGQELDHQLVTFAASLLTLDAERARGARPVARWARAAVLAQRLGEAAPPAPARVLGPLADGGAAVRVVHAGTRDRPVELDRVLAALDDEDEVCALAGDDGCTLVLADDAVAQAAGSLAATGQPVGVSAPLPADADLVAARAHAVALAACAAPGAVLRAEDAPPTVADLIGGPAAAGFARSVLAPLRAGGSDPAPLEAALRAWLRANGETGAAAEALGVHRHTLRERLRQAARLLGRDLDQPQVRVDLWVALELGAGSQM